MQSKKSLEGLGSKYDGNDFPINFKASAEIKVRGLRLQPVLRCAMRAAGYDDSDDQSGHKKWFGIHAAQLVSRWGPVQGKVHAECSKGIMPKAMAEIFDDHSDSTEQHKRVHMRLFITYGFVFASVFGLKEE